MTDVLNLREQIARIDLLQADLQRRQQELRDVPREQIARIDLLQADLQRRQQETRLAPWQIAGTLLARHGYTVLAGQITVTDQERGTDTQLRGRLERLALEGYRLDFHALELIAADFNETGFPMPLRKELGVTHIPPKTQR